MLLNNRVLHVVDQLLDAERQRYQVHVKLCLPPLARSSSSARTSAAHSSCSTLAPVADGMIDLLVCLSSAELMTHEYTMASISCCTSSSSVYLCLWRGAQVRDAARRAAAFRLELSLARAAGLPRVRHRRTPRRTTHQPDAQQDVHDALERGPRAAGSYWGWQ